MIRLTLPLALTVCATLSAQGSIYVPDNMPSQGGANVIPWGNSKTSSTWKNQKYQMLIPASYAKNRPVLIRDLGFAPGTTNVHNIDEITIKVGLTKSANLSATFADNIKVRPLTLLKAKDYTWSLTQNQWTRVGLQRSYTWVPTLGNLVIDIEVRGSGGVGRNTGGFRRSSTIERKYSVGWTANPPTTGNTSRSLAATKVELVTSSAIAAVYGKGCAGSNGTPTVSFQGLPQPGKSFTTNLANARKNSVAISVLGFTVTNPPFPVDLTAAGAPGCRLYQSLDVMLALPTGTTGSVSQKFTVPNNNSLIGTIYNNQFFVLDPPINKLDLVGSNYGRVMIGM